MVATIRIEDKDVSFNVANGEGGPFYCFGIRKSGSTLLHKILSSMAVANGINVVDLPGKMFQMGFTFKDWAHLDISPLLRPGNLYSGFRAYPAAINQISDLAKAPKVFMFRDPRDALVSQYFSDAYSHSLPAREGSGHELFLKKRAAALETPIDEWVLEKCGPLRQTMMAYAPLLDDPNCLSLRYEDYVFQKRRLIMKVANHFEWTMTEDKILRVLAAVDIVPTAENEKKFVRKAIPGDHLDKLRPDTIKKLNHRLSAAMTTYDYY